MILHLNSFAIIWFVFFLFNIRTCRCTSTTLKHREKTHVSSNIKVDSKLKQGIKTKRNLSTDDESNCQVCPEDPDIDDGETTFALIGAVWALGGIPIDAMETGTRISSMDNPKGDFLVTNRDDV